MLWEHLNVKWSLQYGSASVWEDRRAEKECAPNTKVYEGLQMVMEHDVGVTEKCIGDEALYESLGGER